MIHTKSPARRGTFYLLAIVPYSFLDIYFANARPVFS
jgi:hypothetical protein